MRRFRLRRSIAIIGGVIVIIAVGIVIRELSGRHSPPNAAHSSPAVPVTAAVARRKNVPEIVNAIGNVQSIDSVAVLPRVTGAIEKIEFTPGHDVKKGQELFLIDPRPYQAALDQAKAQLAHDQGVLAEAQMDLKRYQTLQAQKSIAGQTAQDQVFVVQQDEGTVKLDQANVETAQLNLDFCHITAPISGRAGVVQVDLGNLIGPSGSQSGSTAASPAGASGSTPSSTTASSGALVSITQLHPIYVTFSVPQTTLNEIVQNQSVAPLEVEAYSQTGQLIEKGKLTVINNQVSSTTGTVTLQATFANAKDLLWPGEYVSVSLTVAVRRDVVTVPASAVMVGPNGDYVYVIGAGNKVARADVQQTARHGGISVISKGISAGQQVVSTGQYRLDNGTQVAIQKADEAGQPGQTAAKPAAATDPP